ncbi:MAG: hypothetical protein ACYCX7_08755, partial [Solirubrobacteraceae bacterium]
MASGQRQPADQTQPTGARGSQDAASDAVAYHLHVELAEAPVIAGALRLLISDEAHERDIRAYARQVLAGLEAAPDEQG